MSVLLSVTDLTVHYGVMTALEKVSFSIAGGEIVTLLGGQWSWQNNDS